MAEPFIGEIRIFGFSFAPRDWATCDGQLVDIAQNAALYAVIGTTYGGDGRTTVALPNFQCRMPMHSGRGPGLTSRRLGERGGVPAVTLSESQIPSHNHTIQACIDLSDTNTPASDTLLGISRNKVKAYGTSSSSSTKTQMSNSSFGIAGSNQAHENMQPYTTLNFCICLEGEYPSRQ